jgi:hypothetical protein
MTSSFIKLTRANNSKTIHISYHLISSMVEDEETKTTTLVTMGDASLLAKYEVKETVAEIFKIIDDNEQSALKKRMDTMNPRPTN